MSGAEPPDSCDVVIVGAGPAGLAAASLCARAGLATIVLDAQDSPGGAVYRAVTATPLTNRAILGEDYWAGEKIVAEFRTSGSRYIPHATVRGISPDLVLDVSLAGDDWRVRAQRVVIATGTIERPFPIPGSALPGVMLAGEAQALLKTSGRVPAGRTVVAGTGPMLWVIASQILNAGGTIEAMLDTTPAANRVRAWPHFFSFLFSPYLARGIKLHRAVRARMPVIRNVTELRAEGEGALASVVYRIGESDPRIRFAAENLLLHQGVVPNVSLATSVGVEHRWDEAQLCFSPVVDRYGATNVPGIAIAGDAAGIGGGQAAAWRGVATAAAIIHVLKPKLANPAAALAKTALSRFARGRKFLDVLYRPAAAFLPRP